MYLVLCSVLWKSKGGLQLCIVIVNVQMIERSTIVTILCCGISRVGTASMSKLIKAAYTTIAKAHLLKFAGAHSAEFNCHICMGSVICIDY